MFYVKYISFELSTYQRILTEKFSQNIKQQKLV